MTMTSPTNTQTPATPKLHAAQFDTFISLRTKEGLEPGKTHTILGHAPEECIIVGAVYCAAYRDDHEWLALRTLVVGTRGHDLPDLPASQLGAVMPTNLHVRKGQLVALEVEALSQAGCWIVLCGQRTSDEDVTP